jgi:hypothetical protein
MTRSESDTNLRTFRIEILKAIEAAVIQQANSIYRSASPTMSQDDRSTIDKLVQDASRTRSDIANKLFDVATSAYEFGPPTTEKVSESRTVVSVGFCLHSMVGMAIFDSSAIGKPYALSFNT